MKERGAPYRRRRAVLLGALGLAIAPGCLGGWTGSDSSGIGPPPDGECSIIALDYDSPSSLGVSGQDLVTSYGGTHTGVLTNANPGFWDIVGVVPESEPVPFEITLDYANGPVTVTSCDAEPDTLAVEVILSFNLDQGLVTGQATSSLEQAGDIVDVSAIIAEPTGTLARLEIQVTFDAAGSTGGIRANANGTTASATFELE